MKRSGVLLGPTIIIGLDDADAVGADRGQQGKKSLGAHRDGKLWPLVNRTAVVLAIEDKELSGRQALYEEDITRKRAGGVDGRGRRH